MSHTSSQTQPDYSQWLTKRQAAGVLDCSTKTVERFAREGQIQSFRWRRPGGGPKIMVYHPVDVERLHHTRAGSAFVIPASANLEHSQNGSETTVTAAEAYVLQVLGSLFKKAGSQKLIGTSQKSIKPEVPIEHRVFLTVREAAAYAGRPERHLRQLIASGALPANKDGHTRVRRADLEKL